MEALGNTFGVFLQVQMKVHFYQSATAQMCMLEVHFHRDSWVRTISVMLELTIGLVIDSTLAHYGMELGVDGIVSAVHSTILHGSTRA